MGRFSDSEVSHAAYDMRYGHGMRYYNRGVSQVSKEIVQVQSIFCKEGQKGESLFVHYQTIKDRNRNPFFTRPTTVLELLVVCVC